MVVVARQCPGRRRIPEPPPGFLRPAPPGTSGVDHGLEWPVHGVAGRWSASGKHCSHLLCAAARPLPETAPHPADDRSSASVGASPPDLSQLPPQVQRESLSGLGRYRLSSPPAPLELQLPAKAGKWLYPPPTDRQTGPDTMMTDLCHAQRI